MSFTIAVAGKGGSGKTTLAGLIILHLIRNNKGPILAVDADPNTNLDAVLGIHASRTAGSVREKVFEETGRTDFPPGISKSMYLEHHLRKSVNPGKGVDLLVMGRPEGPGCYCAINKVLRQFVNAINTRYRYIVIDSKAGMEHLSRGTTQNVNVLLIISSSDPVSIRSARRINDLVDELSLNVERRYLILNNVTDSLSTPAQKETKKKEWEVLGKVPRDQEILSLAIEGKSLDNLSRGSLAAEATEKILEKLGVISSGENPQLH